MLHDVLFDLDGTLTDSGEGIINALLYMMDRLELDPPGMPVLRTFVGPPLVEKLMAEFAFTRPDALDAVMVFREYFNDRGMFENELYPGIPELLETLSAAGLSLHLATSKPQLLALRILDYFGITGYFTSVKGTRMDEEPMSKSEVIAAVLEENGIRPQNAVMVGDRKYDMEGARANHIPVVAVAYGYGTPEELARAQPDYTVNSVPALAALLLQMAKKSANP